MALVSAGVCAGTHKASSQTSSLLDGSQGPSNYRSRNSFATRRPQRSSIDNSQSSYPTPHSAPQPPLMTHYEQQPSGGSPAAAAGAGGGLGFLATLLGGFRAQPGGSVVGSGVVSTRRSVGSMDGSTSTMVTGDVEEGGLRGFRWSRRQRKLGRQSRCVLRVCHMWY
jgi:hypothetical protein